MTAVLSFDAGRVCAHFTIEKWGFSFIGLAEVLPPLHRPLMPTPAFPPFSFATLQQNLYIPKKAGDRGKGNLHTRKTWKWLL